MVELPFASCMYLCSSENAFNKQGLYWAIPSFVISEVGRQSRDVNEEVVAVPPALASHVSSMILKCSIFLLCKLLL
jgi:hypothetical protein